MNLDTQTLLSLKETFIYVKKTTFTSWELPDIHLITQVKIFNWEQKEVIRRSWTRNGESRGSDYYLKTNKSIVFVSKNYNYCLKVIHNTQSVTWIELIRGTIENYIIIGWPSLLLFWYLLTQKRTLISLKILYRGFILRSCSPFWVPRE